MTDKRIHIPIDTLPVLGELREMQLKAERGQGQSRLDAMQRVAEAELRRTGEARLSKLGLMVTYCESGQSRRAEIIRTRAGKPSEHIMQLNARLVRAWLKKGGLLDEQG